MAITAPAPPVARGPKTPAAAALRTGGITVIAGAASGLLVGGVLGRLGMRLLALTSPPIAEGRLTDDAARVGSFTLGGSVTLALNLAIAGAILGLAYVLARRVLPASRAQRVWRYALLTGSVGGALLVHDHPSFDYSILEPTWLAVLLFLALPAAYGGLVAYLVESCAQGDPPRSAGTVSRVWHGRAVTIAGTATYWALVAWGVYNIVTDALSLASDAPSGAPFTI